MSNHYNQRIITSMGGRCPYQCKHCYATDLQVPERQTSIDHAVKSISDKHFDVIYVSGKTDPFYNAEMGLGYLTMLYERYHKDILAITRTHLSEATIDKLAKLNDSMLQNQNVMYVAESICATSSFGVTEDATRCASPWERMRTIDALHEHGIKSLVFIRPVFPECIIPVTEYREIIRSVSGSVDAVAASGLIVTPGIINRLNIRLSDLPLLEKGDSEYLDDIPQSDTYYVNVEKEISYIEETCKKSRLPFFRHSMWALNYLHDHD